MGNSADYLFCHNIEKQPLRMISSWIFHVINIDCRKRYLLAMSSMFWCKATNLIPDNTIPAIDPWI